MRTLTLKDMVQAGNGTRWDGREREEERGDRQATFRAFSPLSQQGRVSLTLLPLSKELEIY